MYEKLMKNSKEINTEGLKPPKGSKYLTPFFEVGYSELVVDPDPIGRGGYGTVYKAKWRGSLVAVKKMKLEGTNDRFNEFLQECQTMMSVRHPNIVLFMGACTVKPNLAIILEYCGNGSLWDVLRNHNTPLPWYLRCKIALDTARGVNYLHNFPVPVLHRDLKSLNILLDDAMNAKLADFGWTRFKAETMTNKIGTYQWMAPEVIQGQDYSEKADVYSFGIILWELATRKPPFRELNGLQVSQEVVKNNLRPPLPKRCPEPFVKLMQKCWDRECEIRPSFAQIIEDLENFLKFLERTAVN
jgi:serine/threonine protein kinase